jgi:flagellar M-ring protein FliF
MGGEPFAAAQLPAMQAAFASAGLMNAEFEGNRIKVPRGQQALYMGALADAGALPANFGTYLERALASDGPFVSRTKREESIKVAKQNELQLILCRMKGVESASVLYDEKKPGGFNRQLLSTASVSIKPVGTQPIEKERITMIRHLVASAFAGLKPESVSVSDLNGRVYAGKNSEGGLGDADGDEYLTRKEAYDRIWQEKISSHLADIPGVVVSTNVELVLDTKIEETRTTLDPKGVIFRADESTMSKTTESPGPAGRPGVVAQQPGAANQGGSVGLGSNVARTSEETSHVNTDTAVPTTIQKREQIGLTPSRVKVAIAIPTSYYSRVWQERNPVVGDQPAAKPDSAVLAEIERQVKEDVRKAVVTLLPATDPTKDPFPQVEVTSFQHITSAPLALPSLQENAVSWLGQNWTTLGTGGLALVSLLILRSVVRSVPSIQAPAEVAAEDTNVASSLTLVTSIPDEVVLSGDQASGSPSRNRLKRKSGNGPSLRDELTSMVKEDPDAAVAVLRNWIGTGT